ncbi:hypothetical protein HZA97_08890 [Candidatus Woesearchaeota archaeon]|nr:hypothetical protein [Candidatus Woesearchaeota archaeon]
MKKNGRSSEFYLMISVVLLVGLLGSYLLLLESGELTGQAVLAKGVTTYEKGYTTTTKGAVPVTKESLLNKNNIQPAASPSFFQTPQPAPGGRDSDVQGANQCTTCGKQYEFRTVSALCGSKNNVLNKDVGIDATCERESSNWDTEHFDKGDLLYFSSLTMTAQCVSGKIVSYGAECPNKAVMTELKASGFPYVADNSYWNDLPQVFEVKAKCEHVHYLDSNQFMSVVITCMREKSRK